MQRCSLLGRGPVIVCKYMHVLVLTPSSVLLASPQTRVFTLCYYHFSSSFHRSTLLFSHSFSITSHDANDTNFGPAQLSSGINRSLPVGDANASSGPRQSDIKIDRGF